LALLVSPELEVKVDVRDHDSPVTEDDTCTRCDGMGQACCTPFVLLKSRRPAS
jgi:hypothetical protein